MPFLDSVRSGRRRARPLFTACCAVLLAVVLAWPCPAQAAPVPRKVLALYDTSSNPNAAEENLFTRGLAMPVNYYGLLFDKLDLGTTPLPDDAAMAPYRAVFTTFDSSQVPDATGLLNWLLRQMDQGRKVIVLGYLPTGNPDGTIAPDELAARVWNRLGFELGPFVPTNPFNLSYAHLDKQYTGFERPYPAFPPDYANLKASGPGVTPWVTVARKNVPDSEGVAVAVTPTGGFIMAGFADWEAPMTFQKQWYIDPFAFVRKTLGLGEMPGLTPTTLNGKRMAFSHIDGDGFNGFTEVDRTKNCAQVLKAEIFEEFDYPISSSVIVAEINPADKGSDELVQLANEINGMPNIEPASHTWTHPFFWSEKNRAKGDGDYGLSAYETETTVVDAKKEIIGSTTFITDHLSPPDKPCELLFWSGDCMPTEEQLAWANEDHLLAINGGDTIMDPAHNSYFSVSPLVRDVGSEYQIYTGQANENILTNLWTGPYHGFRNIIKTFENTGAPYRVMPIDVYYHYYSGEKYASVRALKDIYSWILKRDDIARVFTSTYLRAVKGFLGATVSRDKRGRWVFENYEDCLSIRLAPGTFPDLTASENVLGYAVEGQETYVHLVPGAKRAVVALAEGAPKTAGPYLAEATGRVRDFRAENGGATLRYSGFSTGSVRVGGLVPDAEYRVRNGDIDQRIRADAAGMLTVNEIRTGVVEIGKP